jgi:hypothetical protein
LRSWRFGAIKYFDVILLLLIPRSLPQCNRGVFVVGELFTHGFRFGKSGKPEKCGIVHAVRLAPTPPLFEVKSLALRDCDAARRSSFLATLRLTP